MSENIKTIEQETERDARRRVTINFTPLGGDTKEEKTPASEFFLKSINATFGFQMQRNGWIGEHDGDVGNETTKYVSTQGLRIGDDTVTTFLRGELEWFKEALLPLLIDQSDVEIVDTTKEEMATIEPLNLYEHFGWDETPDWVDDRVTLDSIDFRLGVAVISVIGDSGSDLGGPEVDGAIKGYHDIVMSTVRSMTCTDENDYGLDCKTDLSVVSHRICDTSFLRD